MGRWWPQCRPTLVGLDCGFGQVSHGDLALPLGPEEGTAFAGRAVRVSGWGPLHAVHLHSCMCRRISACPATKSTCPAVHRACLAAWYRARLEAAMLSCEAAVLGLLSVAVSFLRSMLEHVRIAHGTALDSRLLC
eukprot:3018370-Prymnesium_polylepis.2